MTTMIDDVEPVKSCPECGSGQIYAITLADMPGWPQMECTRCACTFYDDGEVIKHGASYTAIQDSMAEYDDGA